MATTSFTSPTRGGTLRWGDAVSSHVSPMRGGTLPWGETVRELRWDGALVCASADAPAADVSAETMPTSTELLRVLGDALAVEAARATESQRPK